MMDNDLSVEQLRTMLDMKLQQHGLLSDHKMFQIEREVCMKLCDTVAAGVKRIEELETELKTLRQKHEN